MHMPEKIFLGLEANTMHRCPQVQVRELTRAFGDYWVLRIIWFFGSRLSMGSLISDSATIDCEYEAMIAG
jgi:hypothetical protein